MTWAGRRKALYLGVVLVLLAVALGAVAYALLSRTPSCADGIRNGTEEGVDCGGACAQLCKNVAREPAVLWARSFEVAPGLYTAAAYIENPNGGSFARGARYVFKLFDEKNILVAEREGTVNIPAQRITPVVEVNIGTGNRKAARAFFEFTKPLSWERSGPLPKLRAIDAALDSAGGKLSATVLNEDTKDIRDITVAAVLFDASGTARAASKSILARLPKGASERIVFTWPLRLDDVARHEITFITTQ